MAKGQDPLEVDQGMWQCLMLVCSGSAGRMCTCGCVCTLTSGDVWGCSQGYSLSSCCVGCVLHMCDCVMSFACEWYVCVSCVLCMCCFLLGCHVCFLSWVSFLACLWLALLCHVSIPTLHKRLGFVCGVFGFCFVWVSPYCLGLSWIWESRVSACWVAEITGLHTSAWLWVMLFSLLIFVILFISHHSYYCFTNYSLCHLKLCLLLWLDSRSA